MGTWGVAFSAQVSPDRTLETRYRGVCLSLGVSDREVGKGRQSVPPGDSARDVRGKRRTAKSDFTRQLEGFEINPVQVIEG